MALFLSENDVKQVLTATMALEAVESAHRDLALGQAQDTPRARTRLPQTVLHILQGALPAQGVLGYKAYTTNRSGNRFLVHVFDAASGTLLAVIEADTMGMIRTGAASGVAARWLARPGAKVAGVFGAGWQAEGHVRGICAACPWNWSRSSPATASGSRISARAWPPPPASPWSPLPAPRTPCAAATWSAP